MRVNRAPTFKTVTAGGELEVSNRGELEDSVNFGFNFSFPGILVRKLLIPSVPKVMQEQGIQPDVIMSVAAAQCLCEVQRSVADMA